MNWLEFVLLAVAATLALGAVLATLMFSLWTIKYCVKEIAKTVSEFVLWTRNACKKITA
jgi:hypothetical protein